MFGGGLVLVSAAAVTYGFLTLCEDKTSFLVLAYLLRVVEGAGGALLWTTMLSLLLARSVLPGVGIKYEIK